MWVLVLGSHLVHAAAINRNWQRIKRWDAVWTVHCMDVQERAIGILNCCRQGALSGKLAVSVRGISN